MNSKDEFMFNFVFDLRYKVAAFSMFLCLLGEVASYLFYSKRPAEVKSWINPSHISPQGTKRSAGKRLQHRYRPVNFAEFLRTPPLTASEDEHGETKQLHNTSQLNDCFL